jgi:hypothetical protein
VAIAAQKGIVIIDSAFSKTVAQAVRQAMQKEFKRGDFAWDTANRSISHRDSASIGRKD